jgi:hypothetical protein
MIHGSARQILTGKEGGFTLGGVEGGEELISRICSEVDRGKSEK